MVRGHQIVRIFLIRLTVPFDRPFLGQWNFHCQCRSRRSSPELSNRRNCHCLHHFLPRRNDCSNACECSHDGISPSLPRPRRWFRCRLDLLVMLSSAVWPFSLLTLTCQVRLCRPSSHSSSGFCECCQIQLRRHLHRRQNKHQLDHR